MLHFIKKGTPDMAEVRHWHPDQTLVFVAGLVEWMDGESLEPFPKEGRRDVELVQFFIDHGVPSERVVYLQDGHGTTAALDQSLAALLAKANPNDFVVLYYCGHGYKDDNGITLFASYDAGINGDGWSAARVVELIEQHFAGARALLIADCCCSGGLREVLPRGGRTAYAALGSSLANESSTGNWTFTEALLDGLRGDLCTDADRNGVLTLGELARHIAAEMAFAEEQKTTFVSTPGFGPEFVVAPAQTRSHPSIGRRVEARSGGKWYRGRIMEAADGEFRIRFYGWNDSYDEWHTNETIREVEKASYQVGDKVEVRWKGEWYPATVLEIDSRVHLIHYDEFDASWDEWITTRRMRWPEDGEA